MIGGRFSTTSRVALIAAAGLIGSSMAAQAADLGGNCCADLEERVAELEATTARKGNRKVSLTVSGHVNEAMLFWDDGIESGMRVVTNGFSMTRFRFLGSAKINADWSAGFLMEFGLGRTGMSYAVDQEQGTDPGGYSPLGIRHQALWVKSNTLGTLWMGHTTDAADGLIDICLGCPITSSSESSLGWGSFITVNNTWVPGYNNGVPDGAGGIVPGVTWSDLGVGQEGYFATRTGLIKYVSPTIAGFSLTASIADADDGLAVYDGSDSHGYDWDIALRYAGEFNSIRVAAGAAYNEISRDGDDYDSWAIVASLQHVPTGLYVAANYREQDIVGCPANHDCTDEGWAVQVGIGQKWSALGKTTFWGAYQESNNGYRNVDVDQDPGDFNDHVHSVDGTIWSFGINQQIDAAAMELYVTYWNVSADVEESDGFEELETLHVVMAGARIKF